MDELTNTPKAGLQRPDFIIIPTQLLVDARLQPLDRILYGYIYWLSKLRDGRCTASNTTLAKLANTSSATVRNSLMHLEEAGYIAKIYQDATKKNRLEIICRVSFLSNVSSADDNVSLRDDTYVSSADAQNKSKTNKKRRERGKADKPAKAPTPSVKGSADAKKVIDYYNQVFSSNLAYLTGRITKINLRLKTYSGRDICVAIRNARDDPFYNGDNDRGWSGSLDYLVRTDENIEKYINFKPTPAKKKLYV